MFRAGTVVDHRANGFDPTEILRDFDYGRTRRLAERAHGSRVGGRRHRPGDRGRAGRASSRRGRSTAGSPGRRSAAAKGDLLRVRFVNGSEHPHTMHFHGIHPAEMDGVPGHGAGVIQPGESFVYEFDAEPFGLHLYHCHVGPLAEHIARGMYGTFIVDPPQGRPPADEMVMVQHGYNTTFDAEGNQLYAVNGIPFHYAGTTDPGPARRAGADLPGQHPRVRPDQLLPLHGNFFHYYPTGTSLQPVEFTDTIVQGQGQRGICELQFPHQGAFMFHAHKTEFAELGWMGFFEVAS